MQNYPSSPVKFIVGSPFGGGVDQVTRIVAGQLAKRLGCEVNVENVTGTSAMIGSAKAAKSAPDGHTLLMVSSQFSVLPAMYEVMPYDTLRDFTPLTQVATSPLVVVVPASLPVNSIVELIALARARKLKYANAGNGGSPHLATESFLTMAGIKMEGVLYEGIMPCIADLITANVDLLFASLASVLAHIRQGRLKALGVTTVRRADELPDVPAVAGAGLAGYEYGAWFAALAPAGIPAEVLTKLSSELMHVLHMPETRADMQRVGYVPVGSSPAQFSAYLKAEMARWAKVVRDAGIRPAD
jgi:tripartite-type tricarboxylate transporter receptor subunit TctC